MRALGMWLSEFSGIKSLKDTQTFLDGIFKDTTFDVQDVNDKNMYYRIWKDKKGQTTMGHAKYGNDALLAEPVLMDNIKINARLFKARKSINRRFFNKNDLL